VLDCRFRKRLPEFDLAVNVCVGVETLALVGRSGSGKSTTLNVVAGLTAPQEGSITLARRALFDAPGGVDVAPEARRIGYLFQHYALFPHLDVAENIGFGLFKRHRAERDDRVRRALEFLDLRAIEHARPAELSGGERQRVALARALVTEPAALLLDEPLAALDVENRSRIRLELRALLRRLAIPTIVVSHDYDDARVLGDRISVMDRGRIVQTGTPTELAASPVDDFVAALTGTNVAHATLNGTLRQRIAFDPWAARLTTGPTGARFEWRGEIVDLRPLGAHLRILVRGETQIRVDVDAVAAASAGFGVGDVVFASVPESAVRVVPAGEESTG